jgi:hypothetical protein
MNIRRLLVVVALFFAFVAPSLAQKTVHVKGYTKKDGTVVKPYDRKEPGSSTTPTYPTTPEASGPVEMNADAERTCHHAPCP